MPREWPARGQSAPDFWDVMLRQYIDEPDVAAAAAITALQADKAPLASPAFTGNPTAPTPAAADNDTSIATTAFVKAAIAAIVGGAPATLDALNELATALGNDPNFATTMANSLAAKAPLASPTFTGDPKAPTPAAGDNDTSIATTAFVKAANDALVVGTGSLVTLYEGPVTYDHSAGASAGVLPGMGPHLVTVPAGRLLRLKVSFPKLLLLANGGMQLWSSIGGSTEGRYWYNANAGGVEVSDYLLQEYVGDGSQVSLSVNCIRLGAGGNVRGIAGQQGPRLTYQITR